PLPDRLTTGKLKLKFALPGVSTLSTAAPLFCAPGVVFPGGAPTAFPGRKTDSASSPPSGVTGKTTRPCANKVDRPLTFLSFEDRTMRLPEPPDLFLVCWAAALDTTVTATSAVI